MSTDSKPGNGDILLKMRDVRIDGFSDERWQHSFLTRVRENARLIELAQAWGGAS